MSSFGEAAEVLLKHEGGFAPEDNGRGAVNFGITQKTYEASGYAAMSRAGWPSTVKNLTTEQAKAWYRQCYWDPRSLGAIDNQRLANLLLNLAVNTEGPDGTRVIRWLQAAASRELRLDGNLGPKTAAAVNSRNPEFLIADLKTVAEAYYRTIAARNPALFADDLPGWLARLNRLCA
jgi:lysozyme family protein